MKEMMKLLILQVLWVVKQQNVLILQLNALIECAYFNPDMIIGKSVKYDLLIRSSL